jgi:hypothetical protein
LTVTVRRLSAGIAKRITTLRSARRTRTPRREEIAVITKNPMEGVLTAVGTRRIPEVPTVRIAIPVGARRVGVTRLIQAKAVKSIRLTVQRRDIPTMNQ